MSPPTCHRVREALAAGNVWGDAALLEHAKGCDICTRELVELKKRRDFRDAFPVLSSIADEGKRPGSPSVGVTEARLPSSRRHLFVMMATVVAIIVFYVQNRVLRAPTTAPAGDPTTAAGPPRYRIYNLENALFDSKVEGTIVRSTLTRGLAAFYVDRLGPDQRFFLTMPDGDLEVRGTRFVVYVEREKTQTVDVAQGTVTLRLQGYPEMVLSEGQRWARESGRPAVTFMGGGSKDGGTPAPKTSD